MNPALRLGFSRWLYTLTSLSPFSGVRLRNRQDLDGGDRRLFLFKIAVLCLAFGFCSQSIHAQTWNRVGTDNLWTDGANWGGAAPVDNGTANVAFAGTTWLTPDMDMTWNVNRFAFNSGAGAFTLGSTGNFTLTIQGGGITNSSIYLEGDENAAASGAPGETVVLTLQNFVLRGNSKFTLQGTATTTFIINVTRQFSLSGNSQIVLCGGVRWDDVFFNVLGTGSKVRLRRHSILQGILTANQRTVRLSGHSTVYGQVVAKRLVLRGAARIIHPPIMSP